jgi:hypothetical protein
MLGKIIFVRRHSSHDALQTFIVVGVTHQYEDGVSYTVVAENDNFAFETLDIFVSSGHRHVSCSWEILGVADLPEYVENKIKRLYGLFIENPLSVEWTEETIATAQETIRLLERSIQPDDEVCLGDDSDTERDTELYTDEDLAEARAAGMAAAKARAAAIAEHRASQASAELHRHFEAQLRRVQQDLAERRAEFLSGEIPVFVVEVPNMATYEALMERLGGR